MAALAVANAPTGSLGWGDSDLIFSEKSGGGIGDAWSAAFFLPGAGVSKFPGEV
jgi:hypothetical protein